MTAHFRDAPSEAYTLIRRNGLTGKINFLREVQLEFHFCTTLSLMDPAGRFQHLKHFLWNVHWQATFLPSNFGNIAMPWQVIRSSGALDNSAHVSRIYDGGPTGTKFSSIITAAAAPNCNAVANAEATTPNVRESRKWQNFDVRR